MRRLRTGLFTAILLLPACHKQSDRTPSDASSQASASDKAADTAQLKEFDRFEDLQAELATRVRKQMNIPDGAADFQIIVNEGPKYPVGTIMHQGTSRPIDFDACAPASPKDPFDFTQMPYYRLKRAVAGEVGLDDGLVSQIADAGVKLSADQDVEISVKDPKLQILADNQVSTVLAKADCTAAIGAATVWFIRGYLIGERSFIAGTDMSADVHAKAVKVANFDVSPSSSSTVGITDSAPTAFIMIVSEVKPAAQATPPAQPPQDDSGTGGGRAHHEHRTRVTPSATVKPVVVATLTKSTQRAAIYIQKDSSDTTADIAGLTQKLAALQAAQKGAPLAKAIQLIPSGAMPGTAQVRYFNDEDKVIASQALDVLKAQYSNARIVRMALPSPKGQYEVWLPKVSIVAKG